MKENLVDVGLGFLIMTLRTQEMKGKVDKWDYFRLICFGTEKKKKQSRRTTYELGDVLPAMCLMRGLWKN